MCQVSKPVINLSWKLPGQPPGKNGVKDLKETMEYLELSNAVIVTSAGNEGKVSLDGILPTPDACI